VTGASSGIGAATARVLAAAGYRVALLARRADRLAEVEGSLREPGGERPAAGEHLVLPCDLLDPDALRAAMARVAEAFGGLDLLVNNAGMGYRARVEELDDALVRRVVETNVTALLRACRDGLPLLRRGDRPVVVNVASVVGRRGIPGQAVYSATKAAVVSIGEALRVEWAREGIAVCTLAPGLTTTGFFEAQPNPAGLADPDLARADGPESVAREVLALDRRPRPERCLRPKWRLLGILSALAPRWADRMLVARIGGDWEAPRR
jgi:NAD(P)-dependent dehydrogenase (short-subunit alcohol dehydrogenase family)